ncbi:MAG: hypothetical protein ACR2FY_11815 [Pirellulaceae bacterium]
MSFPSTVAVVVFLLILGWVGPLDARGGKGGGGGHVSRGSGPKAPGGGQGGAGKHHLSQSHQPAKDKVASGKPAKEKAVKDKTANDKSGKEKAAEDTPVGDADATGAAANKKEKQLANFQRQRDKKIAQAEHLREIAERNGNANLAANADRMEAQAHEQYAQKVSHLEKFGVTDAELDLDGDGLADPYVPREEPLADPLGTLRGLVPLGR